MLRKTLVLCFLIFCLPIVSFGQTKTERTEKQRAIIALEAQIKDMQKQIAVGTLMTRETNARNAKTAASSEVDNAKTEVEAAEQEYRDALANLRSNPQSQTARAAVNIAQQHWEESNTDLKNKEAQANAADDLWQAADNELRREKSRLNEFRRLLKKLEADDISPGEVLAQVLARFIPEQDEKTETVKTAVVDTVPVADTVIVGIKAVRPDLIISVRPEFVAGVFWDETVLFGGSVEAGVILPNGLLLTGDFSGSGFGFGGGANIGFCFNKSGFLKIAAGISAGLYITKYDIDFIENSEITATEEGKNTSIAGFFAKLIGGKQSNFDITYKFLLGNSKVPAAHINYEEDFAIRHSLGLGYTFIKKKNN